MVSSRWVIYRDMGLYSIGSLVLGWARLQESEGRHESRKIELVCFACGP